MSRSLLILALLGSLAVLPTTEALALDRGKTAGASAARQASSRQAVPFGGAYAPSQVGKRPQDLQRPGAGNCGPRAKAGAGRVTTVGTLPNPQFADALFRWAAARADLHPWVPAGSSTRVHSAVNRAGERLHVIQNWSWTPTEIDAPFPMTDLHTGASIDRGDTLSFGPWDVTVTVTQATTR